MIYNNAIKIGNSNDTNNNNNIHKMLSITKTNNHNDANIERAM